MPRRGGAFAAAFPEALAALRAAAVAADAESGAPLLDAAGGPIRAADLRARTVEHHLVRPGGSLPYPEHHDEGSVYTIDVLLCDPSDYRGGEFSTLEGDGTTRAHAFSERGDALCFQSHKFHSVAPLESGERRVLIVEFWLGEARTCAQSGLNSRKAYNTRARKQTLQSFRL